MPLLTTLLTTLLVMVLVLVLVVVVLLVVQPTIPCNCWPLRSSCWRPREALRGLQLRPPATPHREYAIRYHTAVPVDGYIHSLVLQLQQESDEAEDDNTEASMEACSLAGRAGYDAASM